MQIRIGHMLMDLIARRKLAKVPSHIGSKNGYNAKES
jgi:hypothetical protein